MKQESAVDPRHFLEHIERWTASHPKILWLELTSKCPFECFFCMRKDARHPGEHMDFGLVRKVLQQLASPEIIRLNNAGESIHYPHLIDAIKLSKETGARIELVSTLASAPMELLPELIDSGLDQLTVSLHTVDPVQYESIYGFASFDALDARLRRLLELKAERHLSTPTVDISFVATKENLRALPRVSLYARELGIREIQVHRVIWRTPSRPLFTHELHSNRLTEAFRRELDETLESTRRQVPGVDLICANNALDAAIEPGELPAFYAGDLPAGSLIPDCIENPWETINIFSNGDVLACGCRPPQQVLGNLNHQSLGEVWSGSSFQRFRAEYFLGRDEFCCRCPWKKIVVPTALRSELPSPRGWSWQLLRGWYTAEGSRHIWGKAEAVAILASPGESDRAEIWMTGFLPNPAPATANRLEVSCNGIPVGEVISRKRGMLEFDVRFPLVPGTASAFCLEFRTEKCYCPTAEGDSPDVRKLGFALRKLAIAPKSASRFRSIWGKLMRT